MDTTTAPTTLTLPPILYQNTYFWRPSTSAGGRRANEKKNIGIVEQFNAHVQALVPGTDIDFYYSESCKNTYKKVSYKIPDKWTNLTGYIGYCKKHNVVLRK